MIEGDQEVDSEALLKLRHRTEHVQQQMNNVLPDLLFGFTASQSLPPHWYTEMSVICHPSVMNVKGTVRPGTTRTSVNTQLYSQARVSMLI